MRASFCWCGGQDRLTAKFDALFLGVGPAARGAFEDAVGLQLGGNAKNCKDDLGKVGCGVEVRFADPAERNRPIAKPTLPAYRP